VYDDTEDNNKVVYLLLIGILNHYLNFSFK